MPNHKLYRPGDPCAVEACVLPRKKSERWCVKHRTRYYRTGRLDLANTEERFWARVSRSGECWEWTGGADRCGYGRLKVDGRYQKAHRYSWVLANGPIPDGLYICHRCDNPPCVRPDHLFLGDAASNAADCVSKGRQARTSGEKSGHHKLTSEQVQLIRRMHAISPINQAATARKYGVHRITIHDIIYRVNWRHIP